MHAETTQGSAGPVFFWNVDGAVGLNGANNEDDVLFVQWCLYKISRWESRPERLRNALRNTPVNGLCTGREGDPLIASIKTLQTEQKLLVDGRVSPARGAVYMRHGDRHHFLVHYLNAVLRQMHPTHYPRIDLMPEFVWRIRDKATAPFI